MRLSIIGTGYVGLVSGACFADCGHEVTCIDIDAVKIAALNRGVVPIFETDLEALIARNAASGRLRFTTSYESIAEAEAIFLSVGTPTRMEDGEADLSYLFAAVEEIAAHLADDTVIVSKSTVPVGTGDRIESCLRHLRPDLVVEVASCPEFLREGSAVQDFMNPDRVIVGVGSDRAADVLRDVYQALIERGVPFRRMTRRSAEIAKYAANAFLATKISFVNELADYCEKVGAFIDDVVDGLALDRRIGGAFLRPGPGFGGSCFPKDTLALLRHGELHESTLQILETVIAVNDRRKRQMAKRIVAACGGSVEGKTIAILGVTFKAGTDDLRDSPSIPIVRKLVEWGASVVAYDPAGQANAQRMAAFSGVSWADDVRSALTGADAAVIVTEWDAFKTMPLDAVAAMMRSPMLVDLRNIFDPAEAARAGLGYVSIGRPAQHHLDNVHYATRRADAGSLLMPQSGAAAA